MALIYIIEDDNSIREIEEYADITTCYLNCNIQDTARKCYLQIYRVLFGHDSRRNLSTEIIQEEVMNKLEEESIILAIDDLNYLSKNDANIIINNFFRANEFYHSNIALIITINDETFKYYLERNAQSILLGHEIEFKDYTEEEIYTILKYRCELGFKEGVISDSQIKKISHHSAKYGDIREGLGIIYVLAQEADSENRTKIEDEDIVKHIISID